ncbi:DUF2312 domain-containing protein [Sinorhizobium meliloti]|uniref:DUF2312 domain-containing protein n=1 Tax=Rhizobium meliloti TaxID=382 RepID=UPI000B49FECA|nr:GapR family DNA-binding domain-containing protein [Sinorhizobium meliloti]ASQ03632.1 DUF2312 domain-containing protein [Sinorhizobium meliloti]MQV38733.1 DUF2312 domain-containing protein [Sinorhizobium meliloti]
MTDAQGIARDQLQSYFRRWERLEEDKKQIAEDLKELFGEAKALGYEPKAMRIAFREKAKEDSETDNDRELRAVVDTYLDALNGSSRATRAYARENIEKFDREGRAKLRTSEAMDDNKAFSAELVAAGLISEEAHAENIALSNAVAMKLGAGVIDPETGEILDDQTEIATASQGGTASPSPDAELSSAGANAGGEDVESSAERARNAATNVTNAAESVTAGETATNSTAKPKSALRPNCRNPEACGGYGSNHCHTCLKAMREQAEEVA